MFLKTIHQKHLHLQPLLPTEIKLSQTDLITCPADTINPAIAILLLNKEVLQAQTPEVVAVDSNEAVDPCRELISNPIWLNNTSN